MTEKPLDNYIRTFRKRADLSGKNLAALTLVSSASVSRHEALDRLPDVRMALAYALLFGTTVEELFAGELHRSAETLVGGLPLLVEEGSEERRAFLAGAKSRLSAYV